LLPFPVGFFYTSFSSLARMLPSGGAVPEVAVEPARRIDP